MMKMDKNNLQKDIEMNGRVKNRYFFTYTGMDIIFMIKVKIMLYINY